MRSATVREWLAAEGLSQYVELFEQNRIELDVLSDLTERDLQDLGIPLGDRKRLLKAIHSSAGMQAGRCRRGAGPDDGCAWSRAAPAHRDVLRPGGLHRTFAEARPGGST